MNLKCNINGIEYPIVQGVTFSEEYNETLDSATIMISQISQIKDLKPYDDVFIYDNDFKGYPYADIIGKKICTFGNDFKFGEYLQNPYLEENNLWVVSTSLTVYDTVKNIYYRGGALLLEDNNIEFENNIVSILHYDNNTNHIWINDNIVGQENLVFVPSECYYYVKPRYSLPLPQFKIEDMLGTWKFKEIVSIPRNAYFRIGFKTSDNLTYQSLKVNYNILISDIEYEETNTPSYVVYDTKNNWFDTKYQTIEITDVSKVKNVNEFIEFMNLNAIKQDGVMPPQVGPIKNTFYKHFLVDQFSETLIKLDEKENKQLYKYKIELFSETKGLEVVQLPNISVTQPRDIRKRKNVYQTMEDFVSLYTPKEKVCLMGENLKKFEYINKYVLDPNLFKIFNNVYSPEFTLNNPNLRDILTQLMLTKDMIPYVEDGVIKGLDITERKEKFVLDENCVNYINGSRSSTNHCDNLRRSYTNALSQDNTCRMVEYLGFRNKDTALMTLDNMRLETRYPIYKINKVYMCYYKSGKVSKKDTTTTTDKVFLCKQDITPLVKLNSERALLKEDWDSFQGTIPRDINDLAKYRLCTVGYNIGDNKIEGWGAKYNYPLGWWNKKATYIQNIYKCMNEMYPYGIYQLGYLNSVIGGLKADETFILAESKIITPFSETNHALAYKGLFFQVDYNAFYNGCVIHSKDESDGQITINDNSSGSLMLLEQDGLFQKEKINRFGNKATTITARYTDISQLQPLGSVYGDDEIIYHREYNIYDNCINCVYYATKDYVLKNYFTSVYAKHRPYNLMSYEESVNRAENKKLIVLLSTQPQIKDKELSLYYSRDFIDKAFSFTKPSITPKSIDVFEQYERINCGLIDGQFLSDVNGFVSGNSLCFNLRMYDNVSGGVYVETLEPETGLKVEDDFTGSVQDWYIDVDDEETGFKEYMNFELFHFNNDAIFNDNRLVNKADVLRSYEILFKLPKLQVKDHEKRNLLSYNGKINKDNKEVIDMTFQIEPISAEPNKIIFSQWMMKLSDLLGGFNKFTEQTEVANTFGYSQIETLLFASPQDAPTGRSEGYLPIMILEFDETTFNDLDKTNKPFLDGSCVFDKYDNTIDTWGKYRFSHITWQLKQITKFGSDYIEVKVRQIMTEDKPFSDEYNYYDDDYTYKLKKITSLGAYQPSEGKIAFSNYTAVDYRAWAFEEETPFRYKTTQGEVTSVELYQIQCYSQKISLSLTPKENISSTPLGISDIGENETKIYHQNMYLTLNDKEIKKEIVYNEYVEIPFKSTLKVDEVIKTYENKIVVDLTKIPKATKSISVWFLDNILYSRRQESQTQHGTWDVDTSKSSYKFVFGVNLTDEDFARGKVEITLSVLNNMDYKVYDTNHNLIGRIK